MMPKKIQKQTKIFVNFPKNFFEKYFNQLFYMSIAIKHVFKKK